MSTPGDVGVAALNAHADMANRDATAEELEVEAREKFLRGDIRMNATMNPPAIEITASDGKHKSLRLANHPEMMAWRRLTPEERDNNQGITTPDKAKEIYDIIDHEQTEKDGESVLDLSKVRAVHQVPMNTIMHTFEQALDSTLARLRQVMIDRQRKYGSKNIERLGQIGVMYQIDNKYWRLDNLYFDADHDPRPLSAETPDEGIVKEDTLIDLANYAAIVLMVRAGIWGLPMEDSDGNSVPVPE